jgi:hypothetical protein
MVLLLLLLLLIMMMFLLLRVMLLVRQSRVCYFKDAPRSCACSSCLATLWLRETRSGGFVLRSCFSEHVMVHAAVALQISVYGRTPHDALCMEEHLMMHAAVALQSSVCGTPHNARSCSLAYFYTWEIRSWCIACCLANLYTWETSSSCASPRRTWEYIS